MFNPVKAQIAFGRFISFGVNARDVKGAIRPAVAATNAFIFVDDDRAVVLFRNRAFGATEPASRIFAVHTLKFYKIPVKTPASVSAFFHLD